MKHAAEHPALLKPLLEPACDRGIYAKVEIQKEKLELIPVSSTVQCVLKGSEPLGCLSFGDYASADGKDYVACVQSVVKKYEGQDANIADVAERKIQHQLIPGFWLVQPTNKSAEVNMKFHIESREIKSKDGWHGGKYPYIVLRNSKDLKPGDQLKYASEPRVRYPNLESVKKRKM